MTSEVQERKPAAPRRSRIDRITTAWMVVALLGVVATVLWRSQISQSWWLSIHLVTLGVLTNAILQWSWYFTRSLMRLRSDSRSAGAHQLLRQVLFNIFLILLVVSMMAAKLTGIVIAASGIGAVIAWHGGALLTVMRSRLGSRFSVIIRYYVVASGFLVLGTLLGALVAATMFAADAPRWLVDGRTPMSLAHSLSNFLGWIGLTIAGTLVTLWPTMLRTRMSPDAERRATHALWLLAAAVLASVATSLVAPTWVVSIPLLIYTTTLIWGIGIPMAQEAKIKRPVGYACWSTVAGVAWAVTGLLTATGLVAASGNTQEFRDASAQAIAAIGVGGALQIFVGALTYLMPVVIGGGPQALKGGIASLDRLGTFRLVVRNSALPLALVNTQVSTWFWMLVAGTFVMDLVMFTITGAVQAKLKHKVGERQ